MRSRTLLEISQRLIALSQDSSHPTLVAIDGNDGSGKSHFAKELQQVLQTLNAHCLIIALDDFHLPKAIRYRQGRSSPVGFFEDSYDLTTLRCDCLDPIKSGKKQVRISSFNCELDCPAHKDVIIEDQHIVLVEGLFLHREELRQYWDFSVYLKTDFAVSVARGNARFGLIPDPTHQSNQRYVGGNRLYQSRCQPVSHASVVVDNNDLENACIVPATNGTA